MDLRAAAARRRRKADGARVGHVGVRDGAPGDPLVGPVLGDLRLPLDRAARGSAGGPARAPIVEDTDRLEVLHEEGQVLEVAPEPVHLLGRPADGDLLLDVHAAAATRWSRSSPAARPRPRSARLRPVSTSSSVTPSTAAVATATRPRSESSDRSARPRKARSMTSPPTRAHDRHHRPVAQQDADAAGDLADAAGEQGIAVGLVVVDPDQAGDAAGRGAFGQAQPDAEPAEPAGDAARVTDRPRGGAVAVGPMVGLAVRVGIGIPELVDRPSAGGRYVPCGCGHRSPLSANGILCALAAAARAAGRGNRGGRGRRTHRASRCWSAWR